MPKLSIVTINFNNKCGLQSTIESVLRQTYSEFEYIIIDGGSVDGSYELIQQYYKNKRSKNTTKILYNKTIEDYPNPIPRITYWISEPDKGIYDALNKGIEQASGEWIMFLNSGDYLSSDTVLEKIFEKKKTSRYDVLYGSVIYKKAESFIEVKPSELCSFFYKIPFCHQSSLVKTKLLKVRKFDLRYQIASDYDFFCQMYREKKMFKKLDINIAVFIDGGVSTTNTNLMYKEFCEISSFRFKGCFRKNMYICYRLHVLKRKLQIGFKNIIQLT